MSNGDTITLNVSYNPQELETLGYLSPGVLAKNFTVSGLPEYLSAPDKIPAALLQDLAAKSLSNSQSKEAAEEYATVIASSEVAGVYFLKAKDPLSPYKDLLNNLQLNNAVAVMTHYTVTTGSFFTFDVERWYVWIYPNWFLDADGNLGRESEKETCYILNADSQEDALQYLEIEFLHSTDISEIDIAS
ncbi:MAG: hypothetical protein ACI4O5_08310 [Oscillospiraceae bacterium]